VKASFLCYVAIGYVFCVFFFLNSVLFYRLIGKDQIAWWIVVSIILLIGSLIASNVPMMKMLEDADSNIILTVLTATFAMVLFSLGLTLGITYLVTLGASTNVGVIRAELSHLRPDHLGGLLTLVIRRDRLLQELQERRSDQTSAPSCGYRHDRRERSLLWLLVL
jgi:uncharacterized SAM-binding protein YcdF (DUF218 family)